MMHIYIYTYLAYIYIYIISIYLPIFLFLYLSLSLSQYIYIYIYIVYVYTYLCMYTLEPGDHRMHCTEEEDFSKHSLAVVLLLTFALTELCRFAHIHVETHTHKHTYIHMSGDTQCCRSKISDWLVICAPHVWSNQPQEVQCLVKLRIKNSTCCYACYMKENHGNPDVFPLLLAVLAGTMCFFSSTVR